MGWARGRIDVRIEADMARAAYEIRAVGEVHRDLLDDFDVVTVRVDPAGTTIHALLADDAELSGLLEALDRGGHVLVEVHREIFEDPGNDPTDDTPTDS